MKPINFLAALLLFIIAGCTGAPDKSSNEESRMDWWREARFGMFIHWGLYSVPSGEWDGETNHAEWIRTTAEIPLETYNLFTDQFNPVLFDADQWVSTAADAGMKYIVITTKHHDGFCLFDSEYTDFDIMSTPFQRDIMAELSEACEKQGIKMCWYHSIMDWHHPDYLPRRNWEKERPADRADFERYRQYLKNQLAELLGKYGEIGVLWFDGEWEDTWTHEMGQDLYWYVRGLQENIIINNRVDKGRAGMEGMTIEGEYMGDFGTPEQEIPANGLPGVDWESCMTMNNHWGYNRYDNNWKSAADLIRKLADIASKGGNFLLNVGPKADGTFPGESIAILNSIGRWMDIYSEAIEATTASPFTNIEWGRCTSRQTGRNTRLYLHVFDWPDDGILSLSGLDNRIKGAYIMDGMKPLKYEKSGAETRIIVPAMAPDSINSVIILDIRGEAEVYDAPEFLTAYEGFVDMLDVEISNPSQEGEIRFTMDGTDPGRLSGLYTEKITITDPTGIRAAVFSNGRQVSGVSSKIFDKLIPAPSGDVQISGEGLVCSYYTGDWNSIPLLGQLIATDEIITDEISIPDIARDEYFALSFSGYIDIPYDGMFVFALTSDDGSRLFVDGEPVIDNDGLHSSVTGQKAIPLAAGLHSLVVEYFQKSGGKSLDLKIVAAGKNSEPDFYH